MLSFIECSPQFDSALALFVDLSKTVVTRLQSEGTERLIQANEQIEEAGVYWVVEGAIVVGFHERRVFGVEAGECFFLETLSGKSPFVMRNELAVRVASVSSKNLLMTLMEDVEFAATFVELQSVYARIFSEMLSCSLVSEAPFHPALHRVSAGEVLLREGEKGSAVYTLVRGALGVSVQNISVGTIQEGEIFGVIAAFTEGERTATVTATEDSMVMKLPKEEFEALVHQQPSLVTKLVESLSRTIGELNTQVLEHSAQC